jgi:hypothetical protein
MVLRSTLREVQKPEGCMSMSEQKVQNAVVAKLNALGYTIRALKAAGEHGVDITARHQRYSRYFLVECKADAGKDVKSPRSGRETRFLQSVGQIVTRIQPERGYKYGLAFPASYRAIVRRRLHPALLKRLNLHIFLVGERGRVEHVTWRDLDSAA